MANILMPKATAVWLVDNTALTFEQIADFCELHRLEVKGIADGEVAEHMRGVDPVSRGELTRDEISRGEADEKYELKPASSKFDKVVAPPKRKGARYTPVSRRSDRPDAITWFIRHHPEISDAQISKIIGTTKNTIEAIRTKSHWNSENLKPVDPVTLGLCSQLELDALVAKASAKRQKMEENREIGSVGAGIDMLRTNEEGGLETSDPFADFGAEAKRKSDQNEPNADDVFANFGKSSEEDKD
ncbi:DUF1013 domain-containing protein [Hirschia baltica]|uniref:Cytoplasmic protein n=1 Tax=Hirschia baltica (strain ATCC 49814 / DSM 5838 / IFAM 1418) TaxID=582402 RepID=C6XRM5_HIRBI|nr:cell cycle transcriptional regulator TrcR [Hirschia baltica]ACT60635.1 protein of unknown function DUF1013 [Hirschia baltica ATCC 49814]